MPRTYAQSVALIMSQLNDGAMRESQVPKSLQPIVESLVKRGKLCAQRLPDGDYLISKD